MTLALGFGTSHVTARRVAAESLAAGFEPLGDRERGRLGRATAPTLKPAPAAAAPVIGAYETSLLVLAASEDKANPGAGVASPTMPWGWGQLTIDDEGQALGALPPRVAARPLPGRHRPDRRRQHARRRTRTSTSCSARRSGRTATSRRTRRSSGRQKWTGIQMDEQALPIVLAWQLERFDAATWTRAAPHRRVHPAARPGDRAGPLGEPERLLAGHDRGADRRARSARPTSRAATAARGRRRPLRARRRPLGGRRPALDGDLERPVLRRPVLPAPDQGPPSRTAARATASATAGPSARTSARSSTRRSSSSCGSASSASTTR